MTLETVPVLSIAGMAVAMLVSFALPIALFIYSKKKLHAKTAPFFIGCGVFVVMVVISGKSKSSVCCGRLVSFVL